MFTLSLFTAHFQEQFLIIIQVGGTLSVKPAICQKSNQSSPGVYSCLMPLILANFKCHHYSNQDKRR